MQLKNCPQLADNENWILMKHILAVYQWCVAMPILLVMTIKQFVVVTHRKGTMERCDALYGVAMEEKGVSKMISVQLGEKTA